MNNPKTYKYIGNFLNKNNGKSSFNFYSKSLNFSLITNSMKLGKVFLFIKTSMIEKL